MKLEVCQRYARVLLPKQLCLITHIIKGTIVGTASLQGYNDRKVITFQFVLDKDLVFKRYV
jgi:hypothetical protein